MIRLVINLEPLPQERPKFKRVGKFVRTYDPKKSSDYKKRVKAIVLKQYQKKPINSPIKMTVRFYRSIQKNTLKRDLEGKLNGTILPAKRPDIDNCFKAVTDAMNGYVYTDDNLICEVHMFKFYSSEPRTEIEIEEIGSD